MKISDLYKVQLLAEELSKCNNALYSSEKEKNSSYREWILEPVDSQRVCITISNKIAILAIKEHVAELQSKLRNLGVVFDFPV